MGPVGKYARDTTVVWMRLPEYAEVARKRIQATFYSSCTSAFYHNDVELRLQDRIQRTLGRRVTKHAEISVALALAMKAGKGPALFVLRTFCNAWTTGARMRDEARPQTYEDS